MVLFGELIFTHTSEDPFELPALALTFRQINLCALKSRIWPRLLQA